MSEYVPVSMNVSTNKPAVINNRNKGSAYL